MGRDLTPTWIVSGPDPIRLAPARPGSPLAALLELGLQGLVLDLEGQDGSDAGQVEAVVEKPPDFSETDKVVVTVATGAALAAGRIDQTPGLVEPEVLRGAPEQLGGRGDSVQALDRTGMVSLEPSIDPLETRQNHLHQTWSSRYNKSVATTRDPGAQEGRLGPEPGGASCLSFRSIRQFDRLTEQVFGTAARPAAMPMDAWRDGNQFVVEKSTCRESTRPASISMSNETF